MSYDIIGDTHGQHGKLIALLKALGYRHTLGAWRHSDPNRTALFVGDFVDRGPKQIDTLRVVREMTDAGSAQAVLGNHEFNAIAWHTPDPQNDGDFLRRHTPKNFGQHKHFLAEVGEGSETHASWVNWFMTLPLWWETRGLRLVHACWHLAHMDTLRPHMGHNNTLTKDLVERASRSGQPEYEALEALCKGLEIELPHPITFTDSQGIVRDRTRVRWWDSTATTYRQAVLLDKETTSQLPDTPLPSEAQMAYDNAHPVFFGHYWLTGTPQILSAKTCCVDYSAARAGHPLVSYHWDGEPDLCNANLVAVWDNSEDLRRQA